MSGVNEARRVYGTDLKIVPALLEFVERFLEDAGLEEISFEMQMSVEEWYVNVIKHAFGGKSGGTVEVSLAHTGSKEQGMLEIVISDDGPAFDPHSIAEHQVPGSVEEAKIGGLGIFFIRRIMDETEYRREEEKNIFILRKRTGTVQLETGENDD